MDGMQQIEIMKGTWENRKRSNIILWLLDKGSISRSDLAKQLGCSEKYFANKLHRNAFSIEDLALSANACGFNLVLESKFDGSMRQISPSYFGLEDRIKKIKLSEYEILKAKCKALEDELFAHENSEENRNDGRI